MIATIGDERIRHLSMVNCHFQSGYALTQPATSDLITTMGAVHTAAAAERHSGRKRPLRQRSWKITVGMHLHWWLFQFHERSYLLWPYTTGWAGCVKILALFSIDQTGRK
jgi:hypothetical protein